MREKKRQREIILTTSVKNFFSEGIYVLYPPSAPNSPHPDKDSNSEVSDWVFNPKKTRFIHASCDQMKLRKIAQHMRRNNQALSLTAKTFVTFLPVKTCSHNIVRALKS